MAKRFTDTDKYKKSFFRSLPGPYKLLWDYLYHECNHAGIWHVDFEIAQIYLGQDMPVQMEKALELFNKNEVRIEVLGNGEKWFIRPFIEFQYKAKIVDLNPNNHAHASVLAILAKEGLTSPILAPMVGALDKDKDSSKKLRKGGVGEKMPEVPQGAFEMLWAKYPKKDGRQAAQRFFRTSVKNAKDLLDIQNALDCYLAKLAKEATEPRFIKNGSTWFNNWRDWINYEGENQHASNGSESFSIQLARRRAEIEAKKLREREARDPPLPAGIRDLQNV